MIPFSIDEKYNELVPESNKAIRAEIINGGWYLEKLGEKETRATLILEL